ncbi:MAG: hypothetical protein IPI97_09435 [Nitrosomonas sp.]|nr:hypothetical protein [Nitrosomonas sp.]
MMMFIAQSNQLRIRAIHFLLRLKLLIALVIVSLSIHAQHLDIEVWGQGNALFAGYCRTPGIVGCDLDHLLDSLQLPTGSLPIEAATGKLIFPADFKDLPGGDFKTRNPGFQSIQNSLLPNELISYRAIGKLKYWDPGLSAWHDAPPQVQIRLFGGLEASRDILNDFSNCAGQLICFSDKSFGIDGSTLFTGAGIQGSKELVVDITNTVGILHTHLSFFLEDQLNQIGGPIGAYLIELQLLSNARFFPSEPFLVLLNAGLDTHQFATALITLTENQTNIDPPLEPILPISIPGDVDLDNDVDRIDVALILLSAQNNELLNTKNRAFDVDKDGFITRNDAFLAKTLCTLRLCNIPVDAPATALNLAAIYDHRTGTLTLNDIRVGDQHFRAQLIAQQTQTLVIESLILDKARYATPAQYDEITGVLVIPSVLIKDKYFKATLQSRGNNEFDVIHLEEINGIFN